MSVCLSEIKVAQPMKYADAYLEKIIFMHAKERNIVKNDWIIRAIFYLLYQLFVLIKYILIKSRL